jgi:DNA adenine methylase
MDLQDCHGWAKPPVLVKWLGSKRRQARSIVERFPRRIETYREPFLGGGSVLYELLVSEIKVERIECSDICRPLIGIWKLAKKKPDVLLASYSRLWNRLRVKGRSYYQQVRRSFNRTDDPCELFFLLRTCRLGHGRFNKTGKFTTPFNLGRSGIEPTRLNPIVEDWHRKLNGIQISFQVRNYKTVESRPGDLLYLDPPYQTTESYYGEIDYDHFFGWVRSQCGDYLLSLNGFVGGIDRRLAVPQDLFNEHIQIDAGVNPYFRLRRQTPPKVTDSLYLKASRSPVRSRPEMPPRPTSKSEKIRGFLFADPEAHPSSKSIQNALTAQGIEVSLNLIKVVRHHWKRRQRQPEPICRKLQDSG